VNPLRLPVLLFFVLASTVTAAQFRYEIHLSPGGPAGTWDGPLGAELILTDNSRALMNEWNRAAQVPVDPASFPWGRAVVVFRDTDLAERGVPLLAGVFFTGCASGEDGRCRAVVRYRVDTPGGDSWIAPQMKNVWLEAVPAWKDATAFGEEPLELVIGPDDPLGVYTVQAEVHDLVSDRRVSLSRTFTAIEAGADELDGVDAQARAVLAGAERLEVFSLNPEMTHRPWSKTFHNHKILGKTVIDSTQDRRRIFLALNKGHAESTVIMGACFNPRHGLRASAHGRTADLLICFECLQVEAYLNGDDAGGFLTSATPQPVFDDLLRKAGVRLAKKPD